MTMLQEIKNNSVDIPEFPGILMIEPSKIPIHSFNCKIIQNNNFLNNGEDITIDVLPIELGNKLVLNTKTKDEDKIVIEFFQIKNIGTSEKQEIFMENTKLFVEIILKNDTKYLIDFHEGKEDDFISLISEQINIQNRYWESYSVPTENSNVVETKLYYQTPFLADGEELLWSNVHNRGILDNRISVITALTNFRILIYDFETHESEYAMLSDVDQILVENSYTQHLETKLDSFSSNELNALRMGGEKPSNETKNNSFGDIVFLKSGEKLVTLVQIKNPDGLAEFAKDLHNNIIIQDKSKEEEFTEDSDDLEQLKVHLKNSEWSQAEKFADLVLQNNPNELIALRAKLGNFLQRQDWKKIVETSEHMINQESGNFEARILLPEALLNLGELSKAKKTLEESLKLYPHVSQLNELKKHLSC